MSSPDDAVSTHLRLRIRHAIEVAPAVVFDFDGTLVDSNEIKWRGFEHVFAGYPERMGEIRDYCRQLNHTVRGEKFRYICERILGVSYTPDLELSLHDAYAAVTVAAVAGAPEIPGALRFIRSVSSHTTGLLSSTLHLSLLKTLELRGWDRLFTHVQGAPVDKRAWLVEFHERLGGGAHPILFFGDTDEDAASARAAGCVFVRVANGTVGPGELFIKDFEVVL